MELVGQIHIDFDVYSNKPSTLVVGDLSEWLYAESLPSYISITLPGSKKPKNFSFAKNKLTTFNSHNLGISCLRADCTDEQYVELPDGIYTICVKSGYDGIEETKFYLKTDNFELEYAKVAIKYGFEYQKDNTSFVDSMMDIKWLLVVAKSHAKVGDFVKAQRFFEEAKNLLTQYIDCKDCI